MLFFYRVESSAPSPSPQPGGPMYLFFVWVITFDLSAMTRPTSSYATASRALGII